MTDRTALIEKIRKVLALASSSNEHEAALATARAAELLRKHNIQQYEVETAGQASAPEVVYSTIPWPTISRKKVTRRGGSTGTKIETQDAWEIDFIATIADGFNCSAIYWTDCFSFVGRPQDVEIAGYVWANLRAKLVELVRAYVRLARQADRETHHHRNYAKLRRDWLLGAVKGVGQKLQERETPPSSTETAMVLSSQAERKVFIDQTFHRLLPRPTSKIRVVPEAYHDGLQKGYDLQIDPGLPEVRVNKLEENYHD